MAVEGSFKDVYGGVVEEEDYDLRCNYSVGFSFAPEAAPAEVVRKALDIAYERLVSEPNQLGIKTLDPMNPKYRPNYDNSNDSTDKSVAHGWNYHQGPEWVWPLGSWFQARQAVMDTDQENMYELLKRLRAQKLALQRGPWYSLPELTDTNGRVCRDSCQSQAWSLGTFIWFLHQLEGKLSQDQWCSTSN